ncbi:nucleotidyl transferase AbiEii/AbiGii toxin family protein [Cronbergia sp. UHCC 0137]|uniref:nucleotidyl transferase AbiEii/AbiGii toxin family protein n=1 Tax=Cronbergia sp. UHCC 0137 TaxID=3110239 RepID=UPI002B1F0A0F|nr:nucleotidyl transferase AbiEii/AbiGii toxin family protein [Cronbergia sp. UHCC 0137]MEA5617457.1 nucleotidyl transferase AbiEii/AbiGii toxin family protein [Cronbergia sp. UHCC 0137]
MKLLKGSTLFNVWNGEPHRATKDIDFLSHGNNEVEYIKKVFQEICLIECEEDGIIFLPDSIEAEVHKAQLIKKDQPYQGVKVKVFIWWMLTTFYSKTTCFDNTTFIMPFIIEV